MGVPTTPPSTRTIDWAAYVRKVWGDEWNRKDIVYVFSNGKVRRDSGGNSGIYSGTGA